MGYRPPIHLNYKDLELYFNLQGYDTLLYFMLASITCITCTINIYHQEVAYNSNYVDY